MNNDFSAILEALNCEGVESALSEINYLKECRKDGSQYASRFHEICGILDIYTDHANNARHIKDNLLKMELEIYKLRAKLVDSTEPPLTSDQWLTGVVEKIISEGVDHYYYVRGHKLVMKKC